jgi:hypothetical protein
MKQYRINAENYIPDADCVLSPEDPLHDMIAAQYMGGLNAAVRINERKAQVTADAEAAKEPFMKYAREYGIKPGTPAWYALHGTTSTRGRRK